MLKFWARRRAYVDYFDSQDLSDASARHHHHHNSIAHFSIIKEHRIGVAVNTPQEKILLCYIAVD